MLERLIAASYIRPKSSYYTLSIVRAHSAVREHFALVQYQCTGYTARPTSSTSPLGYLSALWSCARFRVARVSELRPLWSCALLGSGPY